jgi:hypothetical protein
MGKNKFFKNFNENVWQKSSEILAKSHTSLAKSHTSLAKIAYKRKLVNDLSGKNRPKIGPTN